MAEDVTEKLKVAGVKQATKLAGPTSYQNKLIKTGKVAMGGAALFIGATSVLDTAVTAKRNSDARKEVERRNKKEEEKMKQEKKYRRRVRRRESRNSIRVGQTVMDMFDQRTGHHKMGSSKNFPV